MAEVKLDPEIVPVEEGPGSGNHRTRIFILVVVVALAAGYMTYAAFPGNALYFLSVSEFLNRVDVQDGQMVRVSGKLVEGSFRREEDATRSYFQLTDKEGGLVNQGLAVSHVGVLPDLFFNPHSEIILEGRYGPDQVFEADTILVKCPSKYQSLEELQNTG